MDVERKRILFSGRVQGVGFRHTAAQFARLRPLAGTVRNLADGRVELILEGSSRDINAMLRELNGHFAGFILEVVHSPEQPLGMAPPVQIVY